MSCVLPFPQVEMSTVHSPAKIAAAFSKLDVHDDMIESIAFHPAKDRLTRWRAARGGKLEVGLFRSWENCRRLLVS
jgi:hypothetical protein